MARFFGNNGKVTVSGSTVTNIFSWTITEDHEELSVWDWADFGGWKTTAQGPGEWSGAFSCNLDDVDTIFQSDVSTSEFAIECSGGVDNASSFAGTVWIKSINPSIGGKTNSGEVTVNFKGNGALTRSLIFP